MRTAGAGSSFLQVSAHSPLNYGFFHLDQLGQGRDLWNTLPPIKPVVCLAMEKQTHGSKIHCRISTEEGGSKQWFSVDSCKNNQEREDEAVGTQDGPGRSFLN